MGTAILIRSHRNSFRSSRVGKALIPRCRRFLRHGHRGVRDLLHAARVFRRNRCGQGQPLQPASRNDKSWKRTVISVPILKSGIPIWLLSHRDKCFSETTADHDANSNGYHEGPYTREQRIFPGEQGMEIREQGMTRPELEMVDFAGNGCISAHAIAARTASKPVCIKPLRP